MSRWGVGSLRVEGEEEFIEMCAYVSVCICVCPRMCADMHTWENVPDAEKSLALNRKDVKGTYWQAAKVGWILNCNIHMHQTKW